MAGAKASIILLCATLTAGSVPAAAQYYRPYPGPSGRGPWIDPGSGHRGYIPPEYLDDPAMGTQRRGRQYYVPREPRRGYDDYQEPYRSYQRPRINCWEQPARCPGPP
jgi:hypothetical protein